MSLVVAYWESLKDACLRMGNRVDAGSAAPSGGADSYAVVDNRRRSHAPLPADQLVNRVTVRLQPLPDIHVDNDGDSPGAISEERDTTTHI